MKRRMLFTLPRNTMMCMTHEGIYWWQGLRHIHEPLSKTMGTRHPLFSQPSHTHGEDSSRRAKDRPFEEWGAALCCAAK